MKPGRLRLLTWLLVIANLGLGTYVGYELYRRRQIRQANANLETALGPNVTRTIRHPDRPHWIPSRMEEPDSIAGWISFAVKTNNKGFRGRDLVEEKREGIFRIAVVGECVAFGYGLGEGLAYPELLEKRLNDAAGGERFEVFNISLFGVPPHGIMSLLREYGLHVNPDLVIFSPGTDSVFVPEHVRNPSRLWLADATYAELLNGYRQMLEQVARGARERNLPLVFVPPTMNSFFLPDAQIWVEVMVSVASEHQVPFFDSSTVIRTAEAENGLGIVTGDGKQRLVRYRDGSGETLVEVPFDLPSATQHVAQEIYDYLDDHPDVRPRLSIDDNHPTEEGQRLLAEKLHRFLREHRLLPEA